ncbi:MAG TPA: preprotein translocase subunit SecE [Patescibacteria group bacterium]|nr:preprotein translocase subunit SecE [Patescibacteria group bacterium]
MTSLINFFKEVRSELFKVIWPTRKDTIRYTALVIVFSLFVAVVLGAADYGLTKLFAFILSKRF